VQHAARLWPLLMSRQVTLMGWTGLASAAMMVTLCDSKQTDMYTCVAALMTRSLHGGGVVGW
jgi:hypothetical protein